MQAVRLAPRISVLAVVAGLAVFALHAGLGIAGPTVADAAWLWTTATGTTAPAAATAAATRAA